MTLRKVLIVCREGVWTTRIHRVVTYTKKRVRNGRSLQSSKEFSFSFCDQNWIAEQYMPYLQEMFPCEVWHEKVHSNVLAVHVMVHHISDGLRHPVGVQVWVVLCVGVGVCVVWVLCVCAWVCVEGDVITRLTVISGNHTAVQSCVQLKKIPLVTLGGICLWSILHAWTHQIAVWYLTSLIKSTAFVLVRSKGWGLGRD